METNNSAFGRSFHHRRPAAGIVRIQRPQERWRKQFGFVLETWIDLQHRVYERSRQTAYTYSERANIGLLAAAAWRCGHIAIEEVATRRSNGWKGHGRIDLFIELARCALCIEAKVLRARVPASEGEWLLLWRVIRSRVREARHEAARAAVGRFDHRLGIVFCVLSATGAPSGQISGDLAEIVKQQLEAQSVDFLAMYTPATARARLLPFPVVIVAAGATLGSEGQLRRDSPRANRSGLRASAGTIPRRGKAGRTIHEFVRLSVSAPRL